MFSQDDQSLRDVIDKVNNCSVNRQRFCVVSIVSKDSLDKSMGDQIAQTILSPDWHKQKPAHKSRDSPRSELNDIENSNEMQEKLSSMFSTCCNLGKQTEIQVNCHVNCESGIIVLNMSSFLEATQLYNIGETFKKTLESLEDPSNTGNPTDRHSLETPLHLETLAGSNVWPGWHQTLVKTLLVLFAMSHIVVFYNPDPSLDFNLVKLLKILDLFRMKSESRIVDLLESIASKQAFSQSWIRQARVACPRALFVFDTANTGYRFTRKQLKILKSELEDQIHSILKRTNLLLTPQFERQLAQFGPNGSLMTSGTVNVGLLSLARNSDFVFLIGCENPKKSKKTSSTLYPQLENDVQSASMKPPDHDCQIELGSLSQLLGENEARLEESRKVSKPTKEHDEVPLQESEPTQYDIDKAQKVGGGGSGVVERYLRRFIKQHISDYQSLYWNQDNKYKHSHSANSVLLPRCDDFFIVLLGLKCLLFPASSLTNRLGPDDRKFVNIYDYFNEDHLFSRRHCLKTRQAAFDYLANRLDSYNQPLASPKTRMELLNIYNETLATVRRLYLNHARGPAQSRNLVRLEEQCSRFWDDLLARRDLNGTDKSFVGSQSNPSQSTKSSLSNWNSTTIPVAIERRPNGLRVVSSCDSCGHDISLMIQSADKKKKLERLNVIKVKRP